MRVEGRGWKVEETDRNKISSKQSFIMFLFQYLETPQQKIPDKKIAAVPAPVYKTFVSLKIGDTSFSTGILRNDRVAEFIKNPAISGFVDDGKIECASFVHVALTYLAGLDFYKYTFEEKHSASFPSEVKYHAGLFGVYPSKNAWEMKDAITNETNKGKAIFWDDKTPPLDFRKRLNEMKIAIEPGDIVAFYYPGSKFNDNARTYGTNYTHLGLIVGKTEQGEPVIAHLFHAKGVGIRIETLDEALKVKDEKGRGIYLKGVLRPDYEYWLSQKNIRDESG